MKLDLKASTILVFWQFRAKLNKAQTREFDELAEKLFNDGYAKKEADIEQARKEAEEERQRRIAARAPCIGCGFRECCCDFDRSW
ncbi:hypothetical protein KAR91_63030 [Candidatus Pacearchaeota archaeon]|nr:hypothetical protein [Candidatus Pacearchaeota archaeon]